jgi:hypothetical protein
VVDEFWGLSGTAWTGIYTVITFGLLLVAVVAAIYARKQWVEGRKARREATRPYVIVTVEPSGANNQLFDLVVRNIGKRPALDVEVNLKPPPKRARETPGHEVAKAKMLNEPIAMIAPGQVLRAYYDSHIERNGVKGLPEEHAVSLNYRDSSKRKYKESAALDIEAMKGTMQANVQTVHDISKTLKSIQQTLSGASALQRDGGVRVEASVETRRAQKRRFARENAERMEEGNDLMRRIFPDLNHADPSK